MRPELYAYLANILVGGFLIYDKCCMARLSFAYPEPIEFVNPFFGHDIIGAVMVVIGIWGMFTIWWDKRKGGEKDGRFEVKGQG